MTVKSQESRVKSQKSRVKSQESRVKSQESSVKRQVSIEKSQESRIKSQETIVKDLQSKLGVKSKQGPRQQRPMAHRMNRPKVLLGTVILDCQKLQKKKNVKVVVNTTVGQLGAA